jgi:chromosome segregation ATPase
MGQDRSEITEQVVKFPPKQQSGNPADEAGQAVIAQIRKAAELANENCDRAMALAHKLAMQLRAAEDRMTQLEAEVALFRDRATRAEGWLQTIHSEIEQIEFKYGTKSAPRSSLTVGLSAAGRGLPEAVGREALPAVFRKALQGCPER